MFDSRWWPILGHPYNTFYMLVSPLLCSFPGCQRFAEHRHHIVYYPDEVIKPLCRPHHEEITILNGQHGRRFRHQLSNKHRWYIWYQWTAGNMKVRRTRKAQEYLSEWDREPEVMPEPMQEKKS